MKLPKSIAVLGSTVFGLIVLESMCRLVFLIPEIQNFNRIEFTPVWLSPVLSQNSKQHSGIHALRRIKLNFESEPDGFRYIATLNKYGFRGKDFSIRKPVGSKRILFIGDSYTEGMGTDDDHTLPILFRESLHDHSLEVVNLGISGANLPQYLQLLRITGSLIEADEIVIILCWNDLDPDEPVEKSLLDFREPKFSSQTQPRFLQVIMALLRNDPPALLMSRGPYPFFKAVPDPSNPLSPGNPSLYSNMDMSQIRTNLLDSMKKGKLNPWLVNISNYFETILSRPAMEHSAAARFISEIVRSAAALNVKLSFCFVPAPVVVSDFYLAAANELGLSAHASSMRGLEFKGQQIFLHEQFEKHRIPYLDTTSLLNSLENEGQHTFHEYDGHLNHFGNSQVAAALADQYRFFHHSNPQ